MRGPEILARTLSKPTRRSGTSGREWQYHSRSDNHSKVACWTILFDLLQSCDAARRDAEAGRIGFGINHVMVGPINKTLDLVVTRLSPTRVKARRKTFVDMVDQFGISLDDDERALLDALPVIECERSKDDVSEVVIALEAKACMTKHVNSLPRLHAEILATGYLAKRAQPRCITVSYSMINASADFLTPSGKGGKTNRHVQPEDTRRVLDMLARAIPLARDEKTVGYEVIGATVVKCRNDGSLVTVLDTDPAPLRTQQLHYDQMITNLCAEYRARFPS